MIVPALLCLVTEEVNLVKMIGHKLEAKCLVPTLWENIKGDLTTDRVCQVLLRKLCLQNFDHFFTDLSLLVVSLEFVSFSLAAISTDGGHIEHTIAKFNKSAALDRNVQVGDINENKVD